MSERILSQKEFEIAERKENWKDDYNPILHAQDAKTRIATLKEVGKLLVAESNLFVDGNGKYHPISVLIDSLKSGRLPGETK